MVEGASSYGKEYYQGYHAACHHDTLGPEEGAQPSCCLARERQPPLCGYRVAAWLNRGEGSEVGPPSCRQGERQGVRELVLPRSRRGKVQLGQD